MPRSTLQADDSPVAVVLAGEGARGAYEIGALSALLPRLEARGERPRVIVGTSVGAINAAYLAATAGEPLERVLEQGQRLWSELGFDDVLAPLLSPAELARALGAVGEFLRVPGVHLRSLLDPSPLARTLKSRVRLGRIHTNVTRGVLEAARRGGDVSPQRRQRRVPRRRRARATGPPARDRVRADPPGARSRARLSSDPRRV
jgi:NTE family protein